MMFIRSASQGLTGWKSRGFTLLEVLVALAVLAVALFSMVHVAGQRAQTLHELQRRQLALQVADNVLNAYLHHLDRQSAGFHLQGTQQQGPYRWYWRIRREATPNPRVFRVHAQVAGDARFDYLLAELVGFSPP